MPGNKKAVDLSIGGGVRFRFDVFPVTGARHTVLLDSPCSYDRRAPDWKLLSAGVLPAKAGTAVLAADSTNSRSEQAPRKRWKKKRPAEAGLVRPPTDATAGP